MKETLAPFLGAFLIGLSKAGLATGLGMLTTPLVASAMPARAAIGVVLPLLCLADLMTILLYWKKWSVALVRWPLLGTVIGILIGMLFVGSVSERGLRVAIGTTGLAMTLLLLIRTRFGPKEAYAPAWWHGLLVGVAAGFSSTISHAAGPIMAIYFLAQKPDKLTFIASTALFFTVNNLLKVPPYVAADLINQATLEVDLRLLPAIPIGVAAGWLLNRLIPQGAFDGIVYALLLLTSLQLLL